MSLNDFTYPVATSDFTPQPSRPTGQNEDAKIVAKPRLRYRTRGRGRVVSVMDAEVTIPVITAESWMVTAKMNDIDLLKHEQGHFDITALGARELYNEVLLSTAATPDALRIILTGLEGRIQGKIDAANIKYDTQTNHYLNRPAQQIWDQKISVAKANPNGTIDDLP